MKLHLATGRLNTIRRLALQAASLIAAAGVVIGGAPHSAAAQGFTVVTDGKAFDGVFWNPPPPEPRFRLDFVRLQCVAEGGAWYEQVAASDEPYVLIFAVNLHAPSSGRVFRTTVFSDVDNGESRLQSIQVWGPGVLGDPDDLIVLTQVMEHDESDVDRLVGALDWGLRGAATPFVQASWGHDAIVGALKSQMQRLIDNNKYPQAHGSLNMDDQVGGIQEVRITNYDRDWTTSGPVPKIVDANDSGGDGHYRAHFELRRS
jgi:hypothetical protein